MAPAVLAAESPWIPLAIYGVDGRLKTRLQTRDGATLVDATPGEVLPDGVQVAGITPDRVSFARGPTQWALGVHRYGKGAFQAEKAAAGLPAIPSPTGGSP
jgi:hypothetical protein